LNNTKTRTTLAIVAILMAATLVVGLTVAATITPSAFAGGSKKDRQDKNIKGGEQDGYKKDRKANGEKDNGSNNGNTNTVQILKQKAKASGKFSIVQQNGQNVICTHPSTTSSETAGTCASQSNQPLQDAIK
jgi:ABC-type antimicrobial peptide transport system permease subunit